VSAHKPTAEAKGNLDKWKRNRDYKAGGQFVKAIKSGDTALHSCGVCQEEYNSMVATLRQAGAL